MIHTQTILTPDPYHLRMDTVTYVRWLEPPTVPPPSPVAPAIEQAPSASGEPKFPAVIDRGVNSYVYEDEVHRYRDAWREYHTAQLSALRAEFARAEKLIKIVIADRGVCGREDCGNSICYAINEYLSSPAKSEKGGAE